MERMAYTSIILTLTKLKKKFTEFLNKAWYLDFIDTIDFIDMSEDIQVAHSAVVSNCNKKDWSLPIIMYKADWISLENRKTETLTSFWIWEKWGKVTWKM